MSQVLYLVDSIRAHFCYAMKHFLYFCIFSHKKKSIVFRLYARIISLYAAFVGSLTSDSPL